MTSAAIAITKVMETAPIKGDGRHARSAASRTKIIKAMVELVAAGDPDPSAASVAEKAGVGLRSVFRHFEEKDLIFHAIYDLLVVAYQPVFDEPYAADDWAGKLAELIDRRCAIYEETVVFRISTLVERYRSQLVAEKYDRLIQGEKETLNGILPEKFNTSTDTGRAIMLACGFDSWRFLRQDEGLTAEQTVAAIKQMAAGIAECAERQD